MSEKIKSSLHTRLKEVLLILTVAVSLFLLLALITYHHTDPGWSHSNVLAPVQNVAGRAGAWLSDVFFYICGYLAFLFPIMISYFAWLVYRERFEAIENFALKFAMISARFIGFLLVIAAGSGFADLYFKSTWLKLPFHAGGILGYVVGINLLGTFNLVGATVVLVSAFFIGITLFTGVSILKLGEKLVAYLFRGFWQSLKNLKNLVNVKSAWKMRSQPDVEDAEILIERVEPQIVTKPKKKLFAFKSKDKEADEEIDLEQDIVKAIKKTPRYSRSKVLPRLDLLDAPKGEKNNSVSREILEERSRLVEVRLADFGVDAKVVGVYPGPVVTRYELDLAAGTKVSKISSLAKDLARSMSVISVRVVEVIPGKSYVGLELPNDHREIVTLQEVVASKQYAQARSPLTLALGKDIAGHPVIVDLAKMPHLLVAGTTGSGKSVSLNTMLLSLLYKSTPEQLRLILIDPKMLELSVYDGIPHLLTPVVTDMKDASSALRWSVVEMERRYRLMATLGVRNIAGYNQKVIEAKAAGKPLIDPFSAKVDGEEPKELQQLPYIVVLADEYADMMVVVGKKVETLIARLAQKARAAGVHLILATQRPSVDVITGLIKANIPTRIAFQVSQKVDSRTILDQSGAEQLLGHGDMLYLPPGSGVPVRVHGAYVTDDEVHRVVDSLKQSGTTEYIDDILNDSAGSDLSGYTDALMESDDAEKDEFYDQAVEFVLQARKVSVSSVQRRFKIGYNRAARIVEAMETAGVVSAMESNGTREVLVPKRD